MNCEKIQNELPLYIDGGVSECDSDALDGHLNACPLCRQAFEDFGTIRNEIRGLSVNQMPDGLALSLKTQLAAELRSNGPITLTEPHGGSLREKIYHWLMPYSVGTVAASFLVVAFLMVMMSDLQSSLTVIETRDPEKNSVLLANANTELTFPELSIDEELGRVVIPGHPPKLNPSGALMSLTKSIVSGDMSNEEVVVVAEVFGNGIARIAEVVEPPNNERAMRELQKAFETDPNSRPFMPSKLEGDAERVVVVLKIQRVDVKSY